MEKKRLLVLAIGGKGEDEGASGLHILFEATQEDRKKRWVAMTTDAFKILKPFLPDQEKIQLIN